MKIRECAHDWITARARGTVFEVSEILHALGPDSVGQTVTIGLRRAGQTQQVSLTIAERPAA